MISLTVASWGNAGVYYISIPLCKKMLFLFFFAVRHAKLDHPFEINAERYIFVIQYISLCSWFGS